MAPWCGAGVLLRHPSPNVRPWKSWRPGAGRACCWIKRAAAARCPLESAAPEHVFGARRDGARSSAQASATDAKTEVELVERWRLAADQTLHVQLVAAVGEQHVGFAGAMACVGVSIPLMEALVAKDEFDSTPMWIGLLVGVGTAWLRRRQRIARCEA